MQVMLSAKCTKSVCLYGLCVPLVLRNQLQEAKQTAASLAHLIINLFSKWLTRLSNGAKVFTFEC